MSHSSPITVALALVLIGAIGAGAVAWGKADQRLTTVETKQEKQETLQTLQAQKDAAQDLAIAGQGKDIAVVKETVQAIDRRMERWEENGFVRPARGGR